MERVVKNGQLALFADDALLFISGDEVEECHRKIQEDLDNIYTWLGQNKLKINAKKTKSMILNNKRSLNLNLIVENEVIERVEEIKYLGIIIDSELRFESHIDYLCKKIAKKLGFIKRIRKDVTTLTLINIYNVIVKPHFEYCSTVLFLCNEGRIHRLQMLQNRAMRSILRCNRYTSINFMLNSLKWLSVKQRIVMNMLIFVFKVKNNIMPKYLTKYVLHVSEIQPYNLRNMHDLRLPNFLTAKSQNSLIYKGFHLFNQLPNIAKYITNLRMFKTYVIEFVKVKF